MNELPLDFVFKRIKLALYGLGIRLRDLDEMLGPGEGVRHKMEASKNRPFGFGDFFKITRASGLDAKRLLGQIAGYGHPFEIDALRSKRAPIWSAAQRRILFRLEQVEARGSAGFEEVRLELRKLELLQEDDPVSAEAQMWTWLSQECRPGAVVALLAALAVQAPRPRAHHFLNIAVNLIAEDHETAAGGKLALAIGRCHVSAGLVAEGLFILKEFALKAADLYGDPEEHAMALYQIGYAAGLLGKNELSLRAMRKALSLAGEKLQFAAMQFLAYKEMNVGEPENAARLYDELVGLPYFQVAPRQARTAIRHSRLAAKLAAGKLDSDSAPEFVAAVAEVREVMPLREQVAAVLDLVSFFREIGRQEEARRLLNSEIWNALDLDDPEIQRKFANLWEACGAPRDPRLATLTARLT